MNESSCASASVRRSREEGERLVREFEQSGQSRLSFCLAQGIKPYTLDYYRQKHGRRGRPSLGELLPVELVGPDSSRGSCLRVELGNGRRIAVEEGFDARLLQRLIAALEA